MNDEPSQAITRCGIDPRWDVIVVGAGIVGAGVFREAARAGFRTLLLDGADFASGTSSRSSKMVHGGFRYLKNAQIKLTLDSVRERKHLLKEGEGLIRSLPFTTLCYQGDNTPSWMLGLGLMAYDGLAFRWNHEHFSKIQLLERFPQINERCLSDGYQFFDAQTDDARLVLRIIQEGQQLGGAALNYMRVENLLRTQNGRVAGVGLKDGESGKTCELRSRVVINATGAWADDLRQLVHRQPRLRRLQGSHLVFPRQKLPVQDVVSFFHPRDNRPVFAFGWEGATLVGTTDVDYSGEMVTDPVISNEESSYLMEAVDHVFGRLGLSLADATSTMAGIRSVLDRGKADPSKESRDEVLWDEDGLITITGGKLTMFRKMACEALRLARKYLPADKHCAADVPALDAVSTQTMEKMSAANDITPELRMRLIGRYSDLAVELVSCALPGELEIIPGTQTAWAELRWAAIAEQVLHLDDLLLRRTRLGNLLPQGGLCLMDRIQNICQPELGWSDERWKAELSTYQTLWLRSYSIPQESAAWATLSRQQQAHQPVLMEV